jgi:Helix-turn-helix domain
MGASMLIDDIADQIGLAGHPAELDEIIKNMWVDHTHGRISEGDMEALDEAARARREALQARRTEPRPKPRAAPSKPRASARRPRGPREKLFGNGRLVPLDREAKNRILVLMRALTHPTEPGKHYGAVTAKAEEVGRVLLWVFHNCKTGLCIPGYDTIAKAAGCHRDTVAEAIKMLEAAGILTWCNRRARVRIGGAIKVIRTSNSYRFIDPGSKSEFPSEALNQDHLSLQGRAHREVLQARQAEARPPWGIPDGVFSCTGVI